jgi:hypothetical protein
MDQQTQESLDRLTSYNVVIRSIFQDTRLSLNRVSHKYHSPGYHLGISHTLDLVNAHGWTSVRRTTACSNFCNSNVAELH